MVGELILKNIIEIKNITKRFKDILAVDDLSFCVKEGEFFAFLGENGAGKSTMINMMCAQINKDSGSIFIDGYDIGVDTNEIKKRIGVVFQDSYLDSPLTVYDNLENRAALYGIVGNDFKNRLKELSELLDFTKLLNRRLKNLSGGQRRRIDIARALIHSPKILILDEPTTGLDPQTRKMIWSVINSLRKNTNMTVFLTTHYMEEASDADYVVILDAGKICAKGTPLELKNKYSVDYINLYNVKEEAVKSLGVEYTPIKDGFRISVNSTKDAVNLIINNPEIFVDFEIIKGKMDDVFLNVTGKKISGGAN